MKSKFTLVVFIQFCLSIITIAQPPQPPNPASCNEGNCTTNSGIGTCPQNSLNVVTNFNNKTLFSGSANSVNAVYRFRNVATISGVTANATVTIMTIYQASLDNVDDDGATDQSGNSIASFFAPRIGPGTNLNNTTRRGYVEFKIDFFKNSTGINNNTNADFGTSLALTDLNYVHYDIDGNAENSASTSQAWFRETGVAKRISPTNPTVLANTPTELVAYTYTDAGSDWTGFAGSACERDGVSRCAQVASSFSYTGAQSSITVRMGYDFKADGNGYNIGNPVRQYGSTFGCFNFPQQTTLPVKLLSFTGSYKAGISTLNWEVTNEESFDRYELERSTNLSFAIVGTRQPMAGSSQEKKQYNYIDNISQEAGTVFYYRLKMIDLNGKFKYSNVIMIKKDQKSINGVTISPNPVMVSDMVTVRFSLDKQAIVEARVIDMAGRIVLKQNARAFEGVNSISMNGMNKLQAGVYTLQLINGYEVSVMKFSIPK